MKIFYAGMTMRRSLLSGLMIFFLGAAAIQAEAQPVSRQSDPREVALDLYDAVLRDAPAESVAVRLGDIIHIFRYRCARVTDYQLYLQRPNLIDLKVKCSGDPLYGVTVASNGYVAVYGGNGIIAGLDQRDAVIYSFGADGALDLDTGLTVSEAVDDTVARLTLGDEYSLLYLSLMLVAVVLMIAVGLLMWTRAWRRRDQGVEIGVPRFVRSAVKDRLMAGSNRVWSQVYRHPTTGIYVVRGRRGRRHLFRHFTGALLYRYLGFKFGEIRGRARRRVEDAVMEEADPSEAMPQGGVPGAPQPGL